MTPIEPIIAFNRSAFLNSEHRITLIGSGAIGGKASGLARIHHLIHHSDLSAGFPELRIDIPAMAVIGTDIFDAFMKRNGLEPEKLKLMTDDRIAHRFQQASLPMEVLGDLRALIAQVHSPLAIRSSSMLEDAMQEPFAGIYATKMTPNNQTDTTTRFNRLVEAIKLVYASVYFEAARMYLAATPYDHGDEKMAVIIQEVAGARYDDRFYPHVSGVARSRNYYAFGNARPEDGVVSLALGLGKTIVDGDPCWTFSPAYPKAEPPVGGIGELMKITQTRFWSIRMGPPPAYDPVNETEYMVHHSLEDAEGDNTLRWTASTLDMTSGRLVIGTGKQGARLLNFAPLLRLPDIPLNDLVIHLLHTFSEELDAVIEMEFALTIPADNKPLFSLLQVRPMVVSDEEIDITNEEMTSPMNLCSSPIVLGNGLNEQVVDVVFMVPRRTDSNAARQIAGEIGTINEALVRDKKPYLLMGYGRWGTSDDWAGIPVSWGQISGAAAIVEAPLDGMNSELSQGSHFFHNVTSFKTLYFSIPYSGNHPIDWEWLNKQPVIHQTDHLIHVRLSHPLTMKVDGRTGHGFIQHS